MRPPDQSELTWPGLSVQGSREVATSHMSVPMENTSPSWPGSELCRCSYPPLISNMGRQYSHCAEFSPLPWCPPPPPPPPPPARGRCTACCGGRGRSPAETPSPAHSVRQLLWLAVTCRAAPWSPGRCCELTASRARSPWRAGRRGRGPSGSGWTPDNMLF